LRLGDYNPDNQRFHCHAQFGGSTCSIMKTDEVVACVLPQFFPKHWLNNPGIVFSDFPSRIRIGYVLRGDGGYSYILEDQLCQLGISREDLHVAAVANLGRLPSASISIGKVPGGAEGWLDATDDNFAAARILLPQVQREFGNVLGEPFFVSLSHRDDCFCWSQRQSPERQQKHVREALDRFLREEYSLTPDILLCSGSIFSLYFEQPTERG
jgi:uncharacterized protein YtpQ (UPF0354 family)